MITPALQRMADEVVAEQFITFTLHPVPGTWGNEKVCYKRSGA